MLKARKLTSKYIDMKANELIYFFQLQRQIFGVCPNSKKIFRLSDCTIYVRKKPEKDWFQKIEDSFIRLKANAEKFKQKDSPEEDIKGRRKANLAVRKFDKVFHPRKLVADDSMGIFHPVDYIVFKGMKKNEIKEILLLDGRKKNVGDKQLQKSILKVIEKENYEWMTFLVQDDGRVIQSE